MKTVSTIAVDHIFDSALALTLDILSTADRIAGGKDQGRRICSLDGQPVITAQNFHVPVTVSLADCIDDDVVILPGLGLTGRQEISDFLSNDTTRLLIDAIRDCHANGAVVAASCSATFVLAEAGLLDGQVATTTWWLSDLFRARYPNIRVETGHMLTRGPGVICAGAAMAQADLVLAVVADLYGQDIATRVARLLLIDQRQYQSAYMMSGILSARHPDVARAELWVRDHVASDFSVADLAAGIGISTRTFARRLDEAMGQSPRRFIQQIRVDHAVHLLQTTDQSLEEIALDCGYHNASSLRRVMVNILDRLPTDFRKSR